MLWFELLPSTPRADLPSCHVPTDSPYPFSVYVHEEQGAVREAVGYSYHFLIEGEDTKHYLEVGLRAGRVQSIDGLAIDRAQCTVYDSPYTEMGAPEVGASIFSLVPLPQDEQAALSGSTIKQKTKVSLTVYHDAVLFSFDRFAGDRMVPMAPGFSALVSTSGLLAGFLFRGPVANDLKVLVLAQISNEPAQEGKQKGKPIAGAIVYRASRALRLFIVFGLAATSASAYFLVQKDGFTMLSVASIGLALFFIAGVGDAYTSRVTLTEEAIEIRANFMLRTYPREAFTAVHWAKGCPVTLSLGAGGKVELPHCGSPNTVRAWLRRGGK